MQNRAHLAAIALFPMLAAFPLAAQELSPANLPPDTFFVLSSRGAGHSGAAKAASSMPSFWEDAAFAQFRAQWLAYVLRQSNVKANGLAIKPTPENVARIVSMLESPMLIGMSGKANAFAPGLPASNPGDDFLKKTGVFFILDATGKTAQLDQLWPQIESGIPAIVARSSSEFSGATVEQFKGPNQTTFIARTGNYFVWSTKRTVIEDLISRLKSGSKPSESLADDPNFKTCSGYSDARTLLELFFRVPDLSKIPVPPNPQIDMNVVLQGLHLDSIHALCGSMSVAPDDMYARGAILADMSSEGLFSILGANKSHFDLLKLVPPSAYSATVGTFDLTAFYKLVRSAFISALAPEQQSSVAMVEAVAAAQLGMPIPDALAMFTGEYATMSLESKLPGSSPLIAVSISNPQQILALIHKVGAQRISSEKEENGITFLTFGSRASTGGPAPAADPSSCYVAIGPNVLLGGTRAEYVRDAVDRLNSPGGSSLADNPDVARLRSQLPHDLLSISITDYSRYVSAMMAGLSDPPASAKISPEDAQFLETMKKFPWSTLFKGGHWNVVGTWKDTDGIHYEGRSQPQ